MAKGKRPLKWIREASAEEIAEAILTVDMEKAVAVAGILMTRGGQHFGARLDQVIAKYGQEPRDVAANFIRAGLRGIFG